MQNWIVAIGKRVVGPLTTSNISRAFDAGKITAEAFIQPADRSSDWRQVSTVDWLVNEPLLGEPRYCLQCDCRAILPVELHSQKTRCPHCHNVASFVNFLDESNPELAPPMSEPWGPYDFLVTAFGGLMLIFGGCAAIALLFAPTFSVVLGFIFLAFGGGLFALTYQHRSETGKYRSHLGKVESALSQRTSDLESTSVELTALKRSLRQVRDELIESTKEEFALKRREIRDELEIAKDQQHAVHRMAERFLTETRKWWTSKLTGQNFQLTKERITKAIEFCKKQGYPVSAQLERDILNQLKADYADVVKREHEKAEQQRMREQMREEQRLQREAQREIERAEREAEARRVEQEKLQQALREALRQAGSEHSEQVKRLQEKLQMTHEQLLEAQVRLQRTKSQAELTRLGNVYVISNVGSFGENAFKVGLTRRLEPLDRVKELGDASVPFPFDVHMMIRSDDAPALEKKLHRALHQYRINRVNIRKEFFRVDLDTIKRTVEKYHGKVEYEYRPEVDDSEYLQSLRISDKDADFVQREQDLAGMEDEDDDMDGMDEVLSSDLDGEPDEAFQEWNYE